MKEERIEILRMLQEGVINVEEAEKLLSALNEGEKKSQEKRRTGQGSGDRQRRAFDENIFCGKFFSDFDKGFADFGKAMGDLFGGFSEKGRFKDFEYVSHVGNNIIPGKGDRLEIRQQTKGFFKGGGDLSLVPSSDEALYIDPRGSDGYEILRKDNVIAILFSDDCEISIPESINEVSVHLFNGGIEALDIAIPINLETFNGEISARGCSRPTLLKTVSGNIETWLPENLKDKLEMNTVSGDIEVLLPLAYSGQIETKTISGEIHCLFDENVSQENNSRDFQSSIIFKFGDGDVSQNLICRTVSGNVEIDRDADSK